MRPFRLELADAQQLPYPESSFDSVVATFLFCFVPDPRFGLAEACRVLKRPSEDDLMARTFFILWSRPKVNALA